MRKEKPINVLQNVDLASTIKTHFPLIEFFNEIFWEQRSLIHILKSPTYI